MCFVSCEVGTKWDTLISRSRDIFTFFCCNFVESFDAEGQSHNTVYALHRFMLGIYCMTVSRSCKGKRVLPNPWHKRLRHINNLRKRRLSTIMLLSQSDLQSRYLLCISHFQLLPAPPPRATAGHFPALSVPGVGHLQFLCCPRAGRLLTPGPFPSF